MASHRIFVARAALAGLAFAVSQPAAVGDEATALTAECRTFSYGSSIDPLSHLSSRIAFPSSGLALPVVVLMHGLQEEASSFKDDTLRRFATEYPPGTFVMAIDMRGRGSSDGKPDVGGREIQDIVDGVRAATAAFGKIIDPEQVHVVGYSGGGGNALSCAARFPDFFNSVTSFFGIADYGVGPNFGIYWKCTAKQRAYLVRGIGGGADKVPGAYRSRSPVFGITNYTGGRIWLFQDTEDHNVRPEQSERILSVMQHAGRSNCTLSLSGPADRVRWLHAAPNAGAGVVQAERFFMPEIVAKALPAWTVPAEGALQIIGYLETKRFTLWIGDGESGFGTVIYDVAQGKFSVVVASSRSACVLTVKHRSPGGEVALAINGRTYRSRADGLGDARFQFEAGD